jgi:hypothetical protein
MTKRVREEGRRGYMEEWKRWESRNRRTLEHLLKWKRLSEAEGVGMVQDQYQAKQELVYGALATLAS